jgi:8-oxo-dGTP pyrophosphatase MutT (NUDIX family)
VNENEEKIMELLLNLDDKNYMVDDKVYFREAVRAIIVIENKLLLIQSQQYQEYKFIGGGVEKGESYLTALRREALEEGGITLKDNIIEFGYIIGKRKSTLEQHQTFLMNSYYYLCEVESYGKPNLQDYEIEYAYELKLIDIDYAIKNNNQIGFTNLNVPWVRRDTKMMGIIKERLFRK